jgi:hypothetical protein
MATISLNNDDQLASSLLLLVTINRRGSGHLAGRFPFAAGLVLLLFLLATAGCAVPLRYTSLDLALLPCEEGNSQVFFRAVEFNSAGAPLFTHQVEAVENRLKSGRPRPVTDLILFIHGWNKNPSSAELDYQNFLCRLHGRLRGIIGKEKEPGGLLVLGVFWPSTITNRAQEPVLLKPLSYYRIRDRADMIAEIGLAELMKKSLAPEIRTRGDGNAPINLHLIGHSFGGRMLVRSLETLHGEKQLMRFLGAAGAVNVVLLNAALPPARFDWIRAEAAKARGGRLEEGTDDYLFNVHSFNDLANRVLFRLASAFNDDPTTCAAGACGVQNYATACVDDSGKLQLDKRASARGIGLNARNVDATRIVFDHSDIYKGRVASLIADLLYDPDTRRRVSAASDTVSATDSRCVLGSEP